MLTFSLKIEVFAFMCNRLVTAFPSSDDQWKQKQRYLVQQNILLPIKWRIHTPWQKHVHCINMAFYVLFVQYGIFFFILTSFKRLKAYSLTPMLTHSSVIWRMVWHLVQNIFVVKLLCLIPYSFAGNPDFLFQPSFELA